MKKQKEFYHLNGNAILKRGPEHPINKLFANKEEMDSEVKRFNNKYAQNPTVKDFYIEYQILSMKELFNMFTVEEICEVDNEFKNLIEWNMDEISIIEE